jgi:hypothetical protein
MSFCCVTEHFSLNGQTQPMYVIHELATGMLPIHMLNVLQVRGSGGCNPGKIFEVAVARR